MSGIIGGAGSKSGIIDSKYCFWTAGMSGAHALSAGVIFQMGSTVAMQSTRYNHGNMYASGVMTAPVTGLYAWGITIYAYSVVDGDNIMITSKCSARTGSLAESFVVKGSTGQSGTVTSGSYNFSEYMEKDDTVSMFFLDENNNCTIYNSASYHNFWGGLVVPS